MFLSTELFLDSYIWEKSAGLIIRVVLLNLHVTNVRMYEILCVPLNMWGGK